MVSLLVHIQCSSCFSIEWELKLIFHFHGMVFLFSRFNPLTSDPVLGIWMNGMEFGAIPHLLRAIFTIENFRNSATENKKKKDSRHEDPR